jgi:hypothetical protein
MRCHILSSLLLGLFLAISIPAKATGNNDHLIVKILKCESGFRSDVYGDGGKAYGIAQFHKETFYRFANKAKPEMQKAGLWPAIYHNANHQVWLLNWAINHGHGSSWTCYTKIKHQERIKKLNEHRKRVEHFRSVYLRSYDSTRYVIPWSIHNLDRYANCRKYDFV